MKKSTQNQWKSLVAMLLLLVATTGMSVKAQEITLVSEDFSLLTDGTPDEKAADMATNQYGLIPATLTHQPGWKCAAAYSAGGVLDVQQAGWYGTSTYTPIFFVQGEVTVTGRVRLAPNETATSNHGFNIKLMQYQGQSDVDNSQYTTLNMTDEWQDFSATFSVEEGIFASVMMAPLFTRKYQLDDIVVTMKPADDRPTVTALEPTNIQEQSFTANWQAVEGAEKYLLQVVTIVDDIDWNTYQYVTKEEPALADVEVDGTSYDVTGLDGLATDYYYYVIAVVGDNEYFSNIIAVAASDNAEITVDAPEALPAEKVTGTSFVACWNRVGDATGYLLTVFTDDLGERSYVYEDKELSAWSLSYTIRNLDPELNYAYYVKAVNGSATSEPSNTIRVYGLDAPEVLQASDITATGFTANWQPTPKATAYALVTYSFTDGQMVQADSLNVTGTSHEVTGLDAAVSKYYAYKVYALLVADDEVHQSVASAYGTAILPTDEETEVVTYIEEDFSRFANGSETDIYYKEYDPEDAQSWGEYVNNFSSHIIPDDYTEQPGWTGQGVAEAGGMAAVSYMPYQGTYWGGYLETPAFSHKGEVIVKARIKAIPQYVTLSEDNPGTFYVNVQNGYYETGELVVFEGANQLTVTDNEWHEVSFMFINTSDDPISINFGRNYSVGFPFFIDDVTVSGVEKVYTVNVTSNEGGTVTPTGELKFREGESQTFRIDEDKDYVLEKVLLDGEDATEGVDVGKNWSEFTLENIRENHTLEFVFKCTIPTGIERTATMNATTAYDLSGRLSASGNARGIIVVTDGKHSRKVVRK